MVRVLVIVALIVVVAVVVAVIDAYARRPRQVQPGSSAEFKNHQDMARWIERALHDDLVRASLPAGEQDRARRLLGEFFGDPPNELP